MIKYEHFAKDDDPATRPLRRRDIQLEELKSAVDGIQYGEVRIIIQDGVVVQIERLEKRRLR